MRPRLSVGGRLTPQRMVAHCLLVERPEGLVLVDTGFGTVDLAERRMGRAFVAAMGAALDPAETALAQVRALGFDPADVTDVVLTHLDLDHVGGTGDFPHARVHTTAAEHAAATAQKTLKDRGRYLPSQWSAARWELHDTSTGGEDWLGFTGIRALGDDVLLVPLTGHTLGHAGVAVRRPDGSWLLHAGDSFFFHGELERPPSFPPGLALFQTVVQADKAARLENQKRLRTLHADHPEVTVFCAHDAEMFDALSSPARP